MNKFQKYVNELVVLSSSQLHDDDEVSVRAALDGQVATNLRRLVTLAERKRKGAFFTSGQMAETLAEAISGTLTPRSIIADPACGAGDLLLAFLPSLLSRRNRGETKWPHRLIALDREQSFVDVARARVTLAARLADRDRHFNPDELVNFHVGDFLNRPKVIRQATHVVLNPPFFNVKLKSPLSWAEGSVSAAALFVETCLTHCRPGTIVAAVLPDVLRSGWRYRNWRSLVEEKATISAVRSLGRFDSWTDIDVFLVVLRLGRTSSDAKVTSWASRGRSRIPRLTRAFTLRVGDVVNNRDPHEGNWVRYLTAKEALPWTTIKDVTRRRRYQGPTYLPPFVVIRRTSSPADRARAIASVVTGTHKVAVDNHLVIARPHRPSRALCDELVRQLRLPSTTAWLNRRIRCRHLTVEAISGIGFRRER